MSTLRATGRAAHRQAMWRMAQILYNHTIRPHLPRKIAIQSDIPAYGPRLFDLGSDIVEHERDLVDAIQATVTPGDTVTLVGGGRGVSSIAAAQATGEDGEVHAYEAARGRVALCQRNVDLHELGHRVHVRHAVVGTPYDVFGSMDGADRLAVGDLPDCDVLVLDCEGSEYGILDELDQRPRDLIIEIHEVDDRDVQEAVLMVGLSGGGIVNDEAWLPPGYGLHTFEQGNMALPPVVIASREDAA